MFSVERIYLIHYATQVSIASIDFLCNIGDFAYENEFRISNNTYFTIFNFINKWQLTDGRTFGHDEPRRGRVLGEDRDGPGRHQPPLGHRRRIPEKIREEDTHRIAGSGFKKKFQNSFLEKLIRQTWLVP